MNIVIGHVIDVLKSYCNGTTGLQNLVRAVELLRDNTDLAPIEVDQIYVDLEIINAIRSDENRSLNCDENQHITSLVDRLQALLNMDKLSK